MNEDFSTSIAWEGQADTHHHLDQDGDDAPLQSTSNANPNPHHDETEIVGKSTTVKVVEAQVELEGTKDTFVSYLVVGKVSGRRWCLVRVRGEERLLSEDGEWDGWNGSILFSAGQCRSLISVLSSHPTRPAS